jgi:hypothetical protein
VFVGSGITEDGVLFSYHANWESAGRWGVEVNTAKRKLAFRPLEQLQVMMKDSVAVEVADIDYTLDKKYKPGLYLQTKAFIESDDTQFITIHKYAEQVKWYGQIKQGVTDVLH